MAAVPFRLVTKTRVPAVEGLFTEVEGVAHLIGAKVPGRESYFFPAHLSGMAGGDPAAVGAELEEVLLSPTGTVWSYTTSSYSPPPPFVANTDPYEPITIAAVKLEKEQMVVLGQCTQGITPDDLEIGMAMELYVDVLHEDDDHEYTVWKWRPVTGERRGGAGGEN